MTEEDEAFEAIEKAQGWRKRQIEQQLGQPIYFKPRRKWIELTSQEYDEIYRNNDRIYEAMMVVATYLKRKNHV